MTDSNQSNTMRRALLDTTVQLDRCKYKSRQVKLESMLKDYEWKFTAGISVVEFKATIIQQCITIHNELRRRGRFTSVRDALLEKQHPQISLRAHIFNNLINIHAASSFNIDEKHDRRLAEKARLNLENIIPRLFRWILEEGADAILDERLKCDRAKEPPRKKRAAFETNLPTCRRGENKFCEVENVIRESAPQLLQQLQPFFEQSVQLDRASSVFHEVLSNPSKELSHSDCRRAGDCLIALEAQGKVTHVLSSNKREWAPLSQAMNVEFVPISFPDEKTG